MPILIVDPPIEKSLCLLGSRLPYRAKKAPLAREILLAFTSAVGSDAHRFAMLMGELKIRAKSVSPPRQSRSKAAEPTA
jgi:hypothetical protein